MLYGIRESVWKAHRNRPPATSAHSRSTTATTMAEHRRMWLLVQIGVNCVRECSWFVCAEGRSGGGVVPRLVSLMWYVMVFGLARFVCSVCTIERMEAIRRHGFYNSLLIFYIGRGFVVYAQQTNTHTHKQRVRLLLMMVGWGDGRRAITVYNLRTHK